MPKAKQKRGESRVLAEIICAIAPGPAAQPFAEWRVFFSKGGALFPLVPRYYCYLDGAWPAKIKARPKRRSRMQQSNRSPRPRLAAQKEE